jgi:hypothetical protein
VSDYGLDDQAIEVRSQARAKDFSSNLCVQTGSEAHPASCKMGTGGPFPGAKRGRGVTLTTHPHLVPRSGMSRSYTSSPPKRLRGVLRDCFAFFFFFALLYIMYFILFFRRHKPKPKRHTICVSSVAPYSRENVFTRRSLLTIKRKECQKPQAKKGRIPKSY